MTRVGLWPEMIRLAQKRGATILWPALAVVPFLIVLAGPAAAGALAVREGKTARQGFDLHYSIVGSTGPYLVILSGGPGEEISSMQGIADELGKTNQCIMLEQRGTGRSRLKTYDPSTINFAAYIEDIEALRQQLHVDKVGLLGNSWGMMLALAYGGTHPDRVRDIIVLGSGPITRAYLVYCNVEIGSVIWHHAACLPSQRWSSRDRFVKRLSCAFVRAAAVPTMRGKRG